MRSLTKLFLAVAVVAVAAPGSARAADATANMIVSASVAKSCVVTGPASAVNFAAYDPISSAQLSAVGQITVRCVRGTGYDLKLSSGNGFKMMGPGGAAIAYDVLQPDGTTSWTTTALTVAAVDVDTSAPRTYDATVKPAVNADVPVGDYTDTVVITVTY
jgi:spore coat protein U domain-containing protein, fimbrial subunit CupE1/2/3/6